MKVKVRAAVAYTATGKYLVAGFTKDESTETADDGAMLDYVMEWLPENTMEDVAGHHFVEAEIEIPDPVPSATVEGAIS